MTAISKPFVMLSKHVKIPYRLIQQLAQPVLWDWKTTFPFSDVDINDALRHKWFTQKLEISQTFTVSDLNLVSKLA